MKNKFKNLNFESVKVLTTEESRKITGGYAKGMAKSQQTCTVTVTCGGLISGSSTKAANGTSCNTISVPSCGIFEFTTVNPCFCS